MPNTYNYVNTQGGMSTVQADSPEQALSSAQNRMADSGVQLVQPTVGGTGTSSPNPTGTPTAGTTGSTPPTGTGTPLPTGNPTAPQTPNANSYLSQVQALSQMSPAETNAQQQLNQLQANTTQGQFNVSQQPIAQGFISGQQAAMQNQANIAQLPLQNQLALAQQQRQMALTAAQTGLQATMPTSLGYGASLVNPISGTTVNGGIFGNTPGSQSSGNTGISPQTGLQPNASTADILGYLAQHGINANRYDAPGYINAIQNGATAQDIISGQAGVAGQRSAAQSGSGYGLNPLTGQYEQRAGGTVGGSPSITGGILGSQNNNTSTGVGSYHAGQLTSLLQSQGKTADNSTLQNLWSQYGNGGAYSNDVTHNSQIYNAMNGGHNQQSNSPATLPPPTTYAQKAFAQDFTSGGLSDKINAQNTAIGHLTAAYDLAQQMNNWSLQPGNAGKNWLATTEGKAAVDNYKLAHGMSSSELASAYGQGTGGERDAMSVLGNSNASPAQIKGFVQTSGALLSSKILSNIQQFKTAYGQNSPFNLSWFISPQNQQSLAGIGIQIHQSGNNVGAYQRQSDGSYKQI